MKIAHPHTVNSGAEMLDATKVDIPGKQVVQGIRRLSRVTVTSSKRELR
jgi:hypothetical protein